MKVIYPIEQGIAVVHPTGELPIEQVARKDVPIGKPYLIVKDDAIPLSREYRDAWEADFENPDGYGIGAEAWFAEQEKK